MTLKHQLGDGEVATILEPLQFPPPHDVREPAQTIVDSLRACEPSRELLGLLSRECQKAARDGKIGDSVALLMFAICVKEALGEARG